MLLLLYVAIGRGQTHLVRHYTINEGLSINAVYAITQDDKGRMWFGTIDGLHSFDGHEIRVWRDSSAVAPGPTIFALAQDDDYHLWVGSDRGLSLLDLKQERYIPLKAQTSAGVSINTPIADLLRDHQGRMWVATFGQGVFCYDPSHQTLSQYTLGRLNTEFAICLYQDHHGTLWVTSRTEGISRFDEKTQRFHYLTGGKAEGIISLYEDSRHRYWAGSLRNGLYRFLPEERQLQQVVKPQGQVLPVRDITENKEEHLLLASDEGLIDYHPETGERSALKTQYNRPNVLNDHHLQCLFRDREGALWVGTYFGGVNYISPQGDNFVHYRRGEKGLTTCIISVMALADGNNLWIGSDDAGFFYWDRESDTFRNYQPDARRAGGPTYHNVHALLQADDKLFIGMYMGGLDIMDLRTGNVRNYMPSLSSRSLYAAGVYAAYRDSEGEIWIGTTMGLNRYEPATDDFERIYETQSADISYIFEDPYHALWVCSNNKGLFRFDRTSRRWEHFTAPLQEEESCGLTTDRILTATVDEVGTLWIGSNGDGLFQFDYATRQFHKVPLGEDLRVIYKIIPHRSTLWITTSDGLYHYVPHSGQITLYNKQDGLQDNQFLPNSGLRLTDGTLFVGGINGFNQFRPDEMVHPASDRPQIILSDFRLFNRPVTVGEASSPLPISITYADQLTLHHDHNIFSLQVTEVSYLNPSKHRFRYKLEGLEREWIYSEQAPHVSYTNLHPGRYTFRVAASNDYGEWSEEAFTLPIRVLPPWWFSLYALVAYVLLFVLLMWRLYCMMVRRQRLKMERMAMEKDKELYQSKISFFTQMIHELRTPLTLILGPLREVMQHGGTVQEALPRLQMVERNGERLFTVVNQLMDFRKTESGQMSVHLEDVELKGVLSGILDRFEWLATQKNVQLIHRFPEGRCVAHTDREAFMKMVSNLLSNALKFTHREVIITLYPAAEGGWELKVTDDGPGIAPAHQAKIFDPFYQVTANHPSDYMGTGIGLALVKKLALLVHSTLQIESEEGKGATFSLHFPKMQGDQPTAEATDTTETKSISAVRPFTTLEGDEPQADTAKDGAACQNASAPHLLVVDDNPDMRNFLQSVLQPTYEVECAENGQVAWQRMQSRIPDLVVSDVMMPVMNGLELCRKMKGALSTSHVPVVLLTAKIGDDAHVEGLESGADLYLPKPFSTEVIRAQIAAFLRSREQLRALYRAEPLAAVELPSHNRLDRDFIQEVNAVIERRLTDGTFSVDELAREVGVSRTALFTKIKALVGMTPNDFIRLVRLKRAAALLAQGNLPVSEVCWQVGFSSTSYFSKSFQAQFGVTPTEFKQGKRASHV